ncbi:MAG: alpha/beta hydrolase [Chitinophagaceae bacterium]|nr:alpha/beta hydrolase [Chitinophagaceae bacterium]
MAPSDLEAPQYTFPATGFAPIPVEKIHFKTIVVASADDPWVSLERAEYFASYWGSDSSISVMPGTSIPPRA